MVKDGMTEGRKEGRKGRNEHTEKQTNEKRKEERKEGREKRGKEREAARTEQKKRKNGRNVISPQHLHRAVAVGEQGLSTEGGGRKEGRKEGGKGGGLVVVVPERERKSKSERVRESGCFRVAERVLLDVNGCG
jgi:hypothetical protein